ncbi:MAG: LON peptidase substrate-binding domain-containing protein, partial [candidate division Zixibacteria bacterium]|nr:LON peptidase substrate-binding domain-containing protein [candidate division Zixibacteria bacterium]
MIIKSRKQLPLLVSDTDTILPVFPIRSTAILPGEKHIVQLANKENLAMLDAITGKDDQVIVSYSPRPADENGGIDLSEISVMAQVESSQPASGGSRLVTLVGLRRVALIDIRQVLPYLTASYSEIAENEEPDQKPRLDIDGLTELVARLSQLDRDYPQDMIAKLQDLTASPGKFADRVASSFHLQPHEKQEILDGVDIADRLATIKRLLGDEVEKKALSMQIDKRVSESLEKKKREVFLRQQLMEIRRELGEEFVEEDLSRMFHNKIRANRAVPQEIADRLLFEADRLKHISSSSAEYGAIKNYLGVVLSLPWDMPPAEPYDLVTVDKKINSEYYGSTAIKEQVLEYLAVWQTSRELQDLPVMCLAGPVGTGKASLVQAIADAMGRRFVRINGTSLTAMEDIKGGSRSEVGAGPGYLIRSIINAGA